MAEPAPFGLKEFRPALRECAATLEVPVDVDLLCRVAAARWRGGGVAVSVPVAVAGAGGAETIAAVGLARAGEELQSTVGEGPSLEVMAGAPLLVVPDLGDPNVQRRWPLFAPAAIEAGICSVVAVPMRVGAARFGVLALHHDRVAGMDVGRLAEAGTVASIALDLVLDHLHVLGIGARDEVPGETAAERNLREQRAPWPQQRFLDIRPEIHQATGMIAIQLGVDLPTALLRLRGRAFTEGRMLSHVAADVVSRVIRFGDDVPPHPPTDVGDGV
ncbi:MAG: ANTAR domain-containing protein [Sporichthyaceae bacterium]